MSTTFTTPLPSLLTPDDSGRREGTIYERQKSRATIRRQEWIDGQSDRCITELLERDDLSCACCQLQFEEHQRKRRKIHEIAHYAVFYCACGRQYASEDALRVHIKRDGASKTCQKSPIYLVDPNSFRDFCEATNLTAHCTEPPAIRPLGRVRLPKKAKKGTGPPDYERNNRRCPRSRPYPSPGAAPPQTSGDAMSAGPSTSDAVDKPTDSQRPTVGHKKPRNPTSSTTAIVQPSIKSRLGPRREACDITSTTVMKGELMFTPPRPERRRQEEELSSTSDWQALDSTIRKMEKLRPSVEEFLAASRRAASMWRRVKAEILKREGKDDGEK